MTSAQASKSPLCFGSSEQEPAFLDFFLTSRAIAWLLCIDLRRQNVPATVLLHNRARHVQGMRFSCEFCCLADASFIGVAPMSNSRTAALHGFKAVYHEMKFWYDTP